MGRIAGTPDGPEVNVDGRAPPTGVELPIEDDDEDPDTEDGHCDSWAIPNGGANQAGPKFARTLAGPYRDTAG
jgi:hypothetical protein